MSLRCHWISAIHIGPIFLVHPWRLLIWNVVAECMMACNLQLGTDAKPRLILLKSLLLGCLKVHPRVHFALSSENVYINACLKKITSSS